MAEEVKGDLREVVKNGKLWQAYFYVCQACGREFSLNEVPSLNSPALCWRCDKESTPIQPPSDKGRRVIRKGETFS